MSAATSIAKRGALTGAALTAEVFDSSPSLLRPNRGGSSTGLQQYFSPPEVAELVAAVNGSDLPTLDLTAGDGSLLAAVDDGQSPPFSVGLTLTQRRGHWRITSISLPS